MDHTNSDKIADRGIENIAFCHRQCRFAKGAQNLPPNIFFLSSANVLGGAERVLQTVVLGLSKRGYNCVLVTPDGSPLQQWASRSGVPNETLAPSLQDQKNPVRVIGQIKESRSLARRIIAKYGPGVFYSSTRASFKILTLMPRDVPKIAHHHDVVSRKANKLLYPRVDRNIFVSNYARMGSDNPSNGLVIYNAGAITGTYPPVVRAIGSEPLKLAIFARITRIKGHRIALAACKNLQEAGIPYVFDIWGEPGPVAAEEQLLSRLKETVKAEELNVAFKGFHSAPHDVMRDYDCILNPSLQEAFGLIPVEAFSLGVPCISYNAGGTAEVCSGLPAYGDYLFESFSHEKLFDSIMALRARASNIDEERAKLADIQADIQTRFSESRQIDEIETLIGQVIASAKV